MVMLVNTAIAVANTVLAIDPVRKVDNVRWFKLNTVVMILGINIEETYRESIPTHSTEMREVDMLGFVDDFFKYIFFLLLRYP